MNRIIDAVLSFFNKRKNNLIGLNKYTFGSDRVNFSMLFKKEATEKGIRNILKEYIDYGAIILNDISEVDIVDTKTNEYVDSAMAARITTNQHNYEWFKREFGPYLTIMIDE